MSNQEISSARPVVIWPEAGPTLTRARNRVLFLLLMTLVFLLVVLELSNGSVSIPAGSVVRTLLGMPVETDTWREIIVLLRMPRAITAVFASAALAVSGLILQTVFRNPLAGPWVLGVSAGAKLGVSVILCVQGAALSALPLEAFRRIGDLSLAAGALAGATATLVLIAAIAPRVSAVTLLIVGLMIQYLAPSLGGILAHLTPKEIYESYKLWMFGEFGAVTWDQLRVLIPVVTLCFGAAMVLAKSLNAMLLGETYARSLGENVGRVRLISLTAMIGLAGLVTAYCGPISFLDLAVPHLCRGVFRTSDHRTLLPAVALTGAVIGLSADLIEHLPWERHVFHVDYVTALIGAPIVLWTVLRNKQLREL